MYVLNQLLQVSILLPGYTNFVHPIIVQLMGDNVIALNTLPS